MKEMKDVKRIVVKVGSSTLTHPQGGLNFDKIDRLTMVLSDMKNSGKDAVHMLEFVYGMGASNTHMIHEHDHGEEGGHEDSVSLAESSCDGNCAACSAECGERPAPPAPLPTEEEKLQNLQELKQVMLALYWNEM